MWIKKIVHSSPVILYWVDQPFASMNYNCNSFILIFCRDKHLKLVRLLFRLFLSILPARYSWWWWCCFFIGHFRPWSTFCPLRETSLNFSNGWWRRDVFIHPLFTVIIGGRGRESLPAAVDLSCLHPSILKPDLNLLQSKKFKVTQEKQKEIMKQKEKLMIVQIKMEKE